MRAGGGNGDRRIGPGHAGEHDEPPPALAQASSSMSCPSATSCLATTMSGWLTRDPEMVTTQRCPLVIWTSPHGLPVAVFPPRRPCGTSFVTIRCLPCALMWGQDATEADRAYVNGGDYGGNGGNDGNSGKSGKINGTVKINGGELRGGRKKPGKIQRYLVFRPIAARSPPMTAPMMYFNPSVARLKNQFLFSARSRFS